MDLPKPSLARPKFLWAISEAMFVFTIIAIKTILLEFGLLRASLP
jgi:hypothetical protein